MNVQIRGLRAACGWSDGRTKGRSADYRGRLFLAGWALLGLAGLGCGAEDPEGLDGVGEGAQELSTCVTIQRGTLGTVQDASVVTDPTDPTRANQNLGSLPVLTTGTIVLQTRESLLQFDLSPIPPGATILSAALGLTKLGNVGPSPVTVHAIGGTGWSEGTVNYNNFGGHSGPALATVGQIGLPAGGTWSVDLTSTVAAWYAGSAANHGVALSITPGRVAFSSSDDPNVSARPALTVCYDVPTCNDGVQNQGESGVDCGGPCSACATCSDGVQNQGETGVDCGGPCAACATCGDGVQNQGETGVDCGGPCAACATCSDGIQNQGEAGVDCGGPCVVCSVTSGRVLDLDAALASGGVSFPGGGCPASALVWSDLSPNQIDGALTGFIPNTCTSQAIGWQGTGTPASPFHLLVNSVYGGRVELPSHPALDFTSAMTVELWINVPNPAAASLVLSKFDVGNHGYYVEVHQGKLIFATEANKWSFANTPLVANTWYHYVATYDNSTKHFYMNGAPDGSVALSTGMTASSAPLWIGDYTLNPGYGTNVRLAAVRLYDQVLSAAEVHTNCLAMQSRFSGLVCN
jgi:hypothetical protein